MHEQVAAAMAEALGAQGRDYILSLEESERLVDERSRQYLGMSSDDFQKTADTVPDSTAADYLRVLTNVHRRG